MPDNTQQQSMMMYQAEVFAGALVGGTAAGVLMTGLPALDIASAMNGALGAAVGVVASPYVAKAVGLMGNQSQLVTVGMAVAVPALVGMTVDAPVAGIGLGAVAGAYAVNRFM